MTQPNPTQPIRLIAVDLDNTLLNSQHQMSERTEKTLKAAAAAGVHVVLATGKTYQAGSVISRKLGLTSPGIYVQGTTVYNSDGSLRSQSTLEPRIVRQALTFAEDRGYAMAIYTGTRILVRQFDARVEELTTHYHEPSPEVVGSLQNLLDSVPVNKLLAVYPNDARRVTALRWQLNMQINGAARLMQAGVDDMLELLPNGVSKGSALKTIAKEMGIPASQIMAIGDAENDVEMVQFAGLGVAVGNASAHLKEIADVVVASNDDDGVAEAVERYVLDALKPAAVAEAPKPEEMSEVNKPA
ncbi:MAG: HAD family phosphatase [Anaerolineae bacterium]|nr:HAD family phosphatase [Anaerolineae bacterium]